MADAVATAARRVGAAEAALAEAQRALADARIALDLALAGQGWVILRGGYGSNDVKLYQKAGDAMSTVSLPELLERLGAAA